MLLLFSLLVPNIVLVREINSSVQSSLEMVTGQQSTRAAKPTDRQTKAAEALLDEVSHEGCMSAGR